MCAKYPYDSAKEKILKTIEIIIDSKPWKADTEKIPGNGIVNILLQSISLRQPHW